MTKTSIDRRRLLIAVVPRLHAAPITLLLLSPEFVKWRARTNIAAADVDAAAAATAAARSERTLFILLV